MTDIAQLGLEVDSGPVRRGSAALTDFSKSARQAAKGTGLANAQFQATASSMRRVNTATKTARGGFRAMRGAVGQLGFQVQDVAVQLQAGQNAMLVLGQQGSQIASIFGPGGAVIGAILAVGGAIIGGLVPALMGGSEEAEKFTLEFDKMAEKLEELQINQLQALINNTEEEIDKLKDMGATLDGTGDDVDTFGEAMGRLGGPTGGALGEAAEGVEFFGEAVTRSSAIQETGSQKLQEAVDRLDEYRDRLDVLLGLKNEDSVRTAEQTEELNTYIQSLEKEAATVGMTEREIALLTASELKATEAERERIRAAYDSIDAYEAEQEATKEAEAELRRYISAVSATATAEARATAAREASADAQIDAIDRRVGATIESLKTEEETLKEWHTEQSNMLMAATDEELEVLGGYYEAKLRLEDEFQERKNAIASEGEEEYNALSNESVQAYAAATEAALGLFSQFTDNRIAQEQRALDATENATEEEIAARNRAAEQAFESGKDLQLAMVGVNTAAAIMAALADPTLIGPARWATVAAIGLTGATQASAISSAQFGGLSTPSTPTAPANEQSSQMMAQGTQNQVTVNFTGETSKDDIANALREIFADDGILFDSDSAQSQVIVNG